MKTTINKLMATLLCLASALAMSAEVTIEQCVQKAEANYPLIKKYDLIALTQELDLSDINKSWLPRINAYGQVTGQNVVPSFPDALSSVLQNMGQEVRGLEKFQYKVGIDISQNLWDGGASKAQSEVARSQQSLRQAQLDVKLYQIRQRVENIYFAILLTEQQIAQASVTHDLLLDNLAKLQSMLRNGTAMQADVDMMEAQALAVSQTIVQTRSALAGYRRILSIFTGDNLDSEALVFPKAEMPADLESDRPELRLFDRRLAFNEATRRLTDASLMPRIGLFAQAYYGYPGFDYFKSMMSRDLSFNIIAGVKVSWNIDAFYTRKNKSRLTSLNAADIAADREAFLFNSRIQTASEAESINGIKEMMKDDGRIVALRTNVRKAAESQLTNGVIDITSLLTKISDENMAKLTSKYHEILLAQAIYKLKYTLGR